jgi:hypothetical protein
VSEQLALEELAAERSAVHGYENAFGPFAVGVYLAGHYFLAGAGLADDNYGALSAGDRTYGFDDRSETGRLSYKHIAGIAGPPSGLFQVPDILFTVHSPVRLRCSFSVGLTDTAHSVSAYSG